MEKLKSLYVAGGNVKWCSHFINTVWQELLYDPEIFIPRCILQRIENICIHKNLHINIPSSIIQNIQKVETTH